MAPKITGKILVVDDDSHILGLVSSIFVSLGIENFEKTTSVNAAIDMVKAKHKFDIIFLDINMQEMNGLDALKEIKDLNPKVKVIMLSGSATSENVKTSLSLGASGFVSKPFNPKKILDAITRAQKA